MSVELTWNVNISAESALTFWGIEPQRKRGISEISRKCQFKPRENDQTTSF